MFVFRHLEIFWEEIFFSASVFEVSISRSGLPKNWREKKKINFYGEILI